MLVRVADRQTKVMCAPGMAINELRFVLGSAFEVPAQHIAGLISEEGVCSPLSCPSSSSQRYSTLPGCNSHQCRNATALPLVQCQNWYWLCGGRAHLDVRMRTTQTWPWPSSLS